jgi:hypothetical protein
VAGEPKPGTTIDQSNVDQFSKYIASAGIDAIKHGFKITVAQAERIQWSDSYEQAKERYSPQVRLDANDVIQNYTSGLPFPSVENNPENGSIWSAPPSQRRHAHFQAKPGTERA